MAPILYNKNQAEANSGKRPGSNPVTKTLPVSDTQLIIRILFNSPFYGAYVSYYGYPGFYHDDTAADYLFARGINDEPEKYSLTEEILHTFSVKDRELIPDIMLLSNTFFQYFELQRDRVSEEPFRTNNFKTLKEIVTLIKLMKSYHEYRPEKNISIDFRIDNNEYVISQDFVIKDIFRHIRDLSESDEYQNIFKFGYLEENEEDYYKFLKLFPGESKCEIDLIKLWTLKRAIKLLADYYISKKILGMSVKNKSYTEPAAECSGMLLCNTGFLPDEKVFESNDQLTSEYTSYKNFLINIIKSYAESD